MKPDKQKVSTSGKTLDLAIVKAAVALGVDQNQVAYEILKESKGGLMKFFGMGQVEISAWIKGQGGRSHGDGRRHGRDGRDGRDGRNRGGRGRGRGGQRDNGRGRSNQEQRAGATAAEPRENGGGRRNEAQRTPREPLPPLDPSMIGPVTEELKNFCASLCEHITGKPVEVVANLDGDKLKMDIKDAEIAAMLSENGKLAEALEHLLRKKPRHLKQELPFRVFIDAGNSRRSREEELANVAREMSEKVVETQRPVVLNYHSSYDRRIIHTTLEGDTRVFTKSIGSGSHRKLMILPSRDQEA